MGKKAFWRTRGQVIKAETSLAYGGENNFIISQLHHRK